jgi:hypothetical protein
MLRGNLLTVAFTVLIGTAVFAAEESKVQSITSDKAELAPSGLDKVLNDCIARNLPITNGGHTWNIDATNHCGKGWACNFSLTLRTSKGLTTNASCSAFVPQNASNLRVCSHTDNTLVWTQVLSNGYQCHN